ncbi:prokaryotic N-terminal methylation motif domain protein [Nautilia profundicola AmH]|uniref:Prokaryotic N-terminal methylation motif domain protein n=1 Tax=Nautilia profundicola (strain ATCC BAA-1463 / DSM 18972 / AmH) TaxID=598659 RepID=B9L5Y3_NAUPA|nr:prepilin-type N-terminal cleavage/methylation domain-containing protein [Nautilia profundicola]ACM93006.1 prokaryotic N-terminal methylation motif domain protein [Nautilia profundicola AmH]
MKAFSLMELIFVIVIMGILSFIGLQFIPDETLTTDTQILKEKVLQKKSNALGYKFIGNSDYVCITFNKDILNNEDKNSNEKVHYKFKSNIEVYGLNNGNTICFDNAGRPFDGEIDENLTKIIHTNIIISLKYKNNEQNFTIYPITGSIR